VKLATSARAGARIAAGWCSGKFFYLFTCEYCFSHWVTLALLLVTGYRLYYDDWRGSLMAFFAVPWVANVYMNFYQRLRVDIRREKAVADQEEEAAGRAG